MTKKPTLMLLLKLLQLLQCSTSRQFNKTGCAHASYTFIRMMIEMVLMIIQKTTGAELVSPTQHLLFCSFKICYWKRNKIIVQDI